MSDASDDLPVASLKKKRVKREVNYADNNDDGDGDDGDFIVNDEERKKKKKKKRKVREEEDAKPPPKKKKKVVKREDAARRSPAAAASAKSKLKKLEKTERLQYAMQSFLWWDAPEPPEGCQWVTMEHAGVSFPEPYAPHGVKMLYDGQEVDLNPHEEEAATFFAAMDPDGMHLGTLAFFF